MSWWNYREAAEKLSCDYRVILPILDGHANSHDDFSAIEDNAARIISQKKDICRYALIESALVVPSKFTYAMIKPTFGSCYGLIKRRWFSKLQFKLRIRNPMN